MALVKCPDCGKEISSWSKTCIHCGCPTPSYAADGKMFECVDCGKTYYTWSGNNLCPSCGMKKVVDDYNKKIEEKSSKYENWRFAFDYKIF